MIKPFDRKTAIRRVSSICRKAVAPHGFEGTGQTWKAITESNAQLINLQTSRNDNLSTLSFTINVGVFFPDIYRARNDALPSPPIKEIHCCPRERVGSLFFGGDKWWQVDRETDESVLEKELNELIVLKIIPWLQQFVMLDDVFKHLRRRKQYFDAGVVAYAMGHEDTSRWIQKAIDTAPHDLAARAVQIWARDHSVDVDAR